MKRLIPAICTILLFSGCKKAIENLQEDIIIKAMTDGRWVITSFTQNSNNITSSFSNYQFQYYANRTVDAIYNGSVQKTGSWDGNAATMTTWADFNGAVSPLSLINGSWHIDDNSWAYVVATQSTATETKTMRLEKQ